MARILAEAYEARFDTPVPAIVRSEPSEGATDLTPASKFTLRWNQPVSDAELARGIGLRAASKANASLAFDVHRPDPNNLSLAEIVPRGPLPKDSAIELRISDKLHGIEGSRPAARQKLAFRTYAPLAVASLTCPRDTPHKECAPGSSLNLELSNPVKLGDLKRALSIEPPIAIKWGARDDNDWVNWVDVNARFGAARKYTVRLHATLPGVSGQKGAAGGDAMLRDHYGQALARDWSSTIAFDDAWPSAEIGVEGTYLESVQRPDVPILSVNVTELHLATLALNEDQVMALEDTRRSMPRTLASLAAIGAKPTEVRPAGARNAVAKYWVHGDDVLGKGGRGAMAVAVEYTERPGTQEARQSSSLQILQVTDLAITAKMSLQGHWCGSRGCRPEHRSPEPA